MTAFSFSYAPKASSALASINPIQSRGEGLRFAANAPMSFLRQNPEIVTEGFWKGRQALTEGVVKGVTSALSGVTGALTQKAADAKAITDAKEAHNRAVEIARIKSAPTENEEIYKSNQLAIQREQLRKLQTENNNVDTPQDDTVAEGDTSIIDQIESIITPAAKAVESAPPTKPPTKPPAAPAAPAAAPAPDPAPDPANVTSADPDTVFQTASTAIPESTKNVLQAVLKEQVLEKLAKNGFIDKNALDEYKKIKSKQELITSRPKATIPATPTANKSDVLQDLSFSNINITPSEQPQLLRGEGYQLPVVESEFPTIGLPESKGQLVLDGATLPLEQVTGAEGNAPLAKVEPVLPAAVTSEPATATPELTPEPVPERTQEEIINQYVGLLTNKAYRGAGDARRAKQVLEKLGLKAEIEVEKGEKGSRLHYVKVVDEAPAAKPIPEGFYVESIKDANGIETYVYKPKVPVKQQIATFDNGIKKANVLKKTLEKIEKIAPGYLFAGAGGVSGLMKYNPFANDAKTTRALLDTVKGIVGFDELVALKAQGGTLGALSDKELDMLTSLKGSINPDMDEATFLENIKSMRESTDRLIAGLEDDKKQVTNVEKQTNFQSIQTETPKYQKGVSSFVKDGYKYVWDGTEFKLSK